MYSFNITHPDINTNYTTSCTYPSASGDSIVNVFDSTGFRAGDLMQIGAYDDQQAQIVQIISIPSVTSINVGTLIFDVSPDAQIVKVFFNYWNVFYSATGVGGTYLPLSPIALSVNNISTQYVDPNGISPYSYKVQGYNSFTGQVGSFSSELPYGGYPQYAVAPMVDRVFDMFGETNLQTFVTRQAILSYFNELLEKIHFQLTGGESPLYIEDYEFQAPITSNNELVVDLSVLNIINLILVEYSVDNGLSYSRQMEPHDFRFGLQSPQNSDYAYEFFNSSLRIYPTVQTNVKIRVWYYTNPVLLQQDGDLLPGPLQASSRLFVDYAIMRAHEKDRKFMGNSRAPEFASFYQTRLFGHSEVADDQGEVGLIVDRLKSRIKQGDFAIAQTEDFFSTFFGSS